MRTGVICIAEGRSTGVLCGLRIRRLDVCSIKRRIPGAVSSAETEEVLEVY